MNAEYYRVDLAKVKRFLKALQKAQVRILEREKNKQMLLQEIEKIKVISQDKRYSSEKIKNELSALQEKIDQVMSPRIEQKKEEIEALKLALAERDKKINELATSLENLKQKLLHRHLQKKLPEIKKKIKENINARRQLEKIEMMLMRLEKKHYELLGKPHLDKMKLKELEERIKLLKETIKKIKAKH